MAANATEGEDPNVIDAYNIHTSSRYLELTRRKLELTRLPREAALPEHRRWEYGTPKSALEPLVDFWLEHYDWRAQEAILNTSLPQFRTSIPLSSATAEDSNAGNTLVRLHFVHKRSDKENAIPLLYCHGWPGSFIEVAKIVDPLTSPVSVVGEGGGIVDDGVSGLDSFIGEHRDTQLREEQAFHVVAPSIPGFGFSDPSKDGFGLQGTAEVFDKLMKKLGYSRYIIHGSGWGFKIARIITLHHPESCIAVHTTTPGTCIPTPSLSIAPGAWLKFHIARLSGARLPLLNFGYTPADFRFPQRRPKSAKSRKSKKSSANVEATADSVGEADGGDEKKGVAEANQNDARSQSVLPPLSNAVSLRPQTLAYSLCDSPTGLLACMLDTLQRPPPETPPLRTNKVSTSDNGGEDGTPVAGRTQEESEIGVAAARTHSTTQSHSQAVQSADKDTSSYLKAYTPTDILNFTMLSWLPGPEAGLRWLHQVSVSQNKDLWSKWCTVPVGISAFKSTAGDAEEMECPMWAGAWMKLNWIRRRDVNVGCFAAWERPDEVVVDLRAFVREVLEKEATTTETTTEATDESEREESE